MGYGQYDLTQVKPSSSDQFCRKRPEANGLLTKREDAERSTEFDQVWPNLTKLNHLLNVLGPAAGRSMPPFLQSSAEIVDAPRPFLMFLQSEKMNREATEMGLVNAISGANAFRACIGCLIAPLLPAERVNGPMIVPIKPT